MMDSIDRFARTHASHLRKNARRQARHAAKHSDEEAIHDLRVSIRRLSECLREFGQFLPPQKTKRTLKRLHKLMDLAAEIRNRDIAIALAGDVADALVATLQNERTQLKRKLHRALVRWRRRASS